MARRVDPRLPGPVVELGPGTGPVTEALVERGVAQERLVLVEYDAEFCALLARRYPRARVVQGDAYALTVTLAGVLDHSVAAIVSSLPLLTRPERDRAQLLADAARILAPGAPFVQFTYGVTSPVPRQPWLVAEASPPIWRNIPPARVWTYRRSPGAEISPVLPPDLIDRLRSELRDRSGRVREEWLDRATRARMEWQARSGRVRAHEGLAFLRRLAEADECGVRPPKTRQRTRRDGPA
jgi:phosphatidylethanolamine/phosphatidyl-N-methylethanolamine N-methyltransferase